MTSILLHKPKSTFTFNDYIRLLSKVTQDSELEAKVNRDLSNLEIFSQEIQLLLDIAPWAKQKFLLIKAEIEDNISTSRKFDFLVDFHHYPEIHTLIGLLREQGFSELLLNQIIVGEGQNPEIVSKNLRITLRLEELRRDVKSRLKKLNDRVNDLTVDSFLPNISFELLRLSDVIKKASSTVKLNSLDRTIKHLLTLIELFSECQESGYSKELSAQFCAQYIDQSEKKTKAKIKQVAKINGANWVGLDKDGKVCIPYTNQAIFRSGKTGDTWINMGSLSFDASSGKTTVEAELNRANTQKIAKIGDWKVPEKTDLQELMLDNKVSCLSEVSTIWISGLDQLGRANAIDIHTKNTLLAGAKAKFFLLLIKKQ